MTPAAVAAAVPIEGDGAGADASAGAATALRWQRLTTPSSASPQTPPDACETFLGGLHYSAARADKAAQPATLGFAGMRSLLGAAPCADHWLAQGPITSGHTGAVQWRHNGHWLYGALALQQPPGDGLEAFTRHVYGQVFAALRETGLTHLQRVWNYVPAINEDVDGLERYRQFNAGRQQAFIDDGRDVLGGSPAACALGTHADVSQGLLRVHFLAGRKAAVPIENPRQVSAYRYPADYGVRRPSFSRAALVDVGGGCVALLISGTASIVDHRSVHLGDVQAQTRETLANLQAVIDQARTRTTARLDLSDLACTVYVRQSDQAEAVRAVLADAVGPTCAANAVYLEADVCRSELLVEIEAQCLAPGALLN